MDDKPDAEDRRAYLGFIENAIARMASETTTLKAWLVPVITAAYGYALISSSWVVALVGIIATLIVGWQAALYLRQEHAYRALYALAVAGRTLAFDMSIESMLRHSSSDPNNDVQVNPAISWWPVMWSWSIGGFFGAIFLGGIAIMVTTLAQ